MNDLNYCGNTIKSLDDIINGPGCGTDIDSIDQIIDGPTCDTSIEDLDDVTGLMGYYEPKGKHICELDDAAPLQKNDCFLLTKANDQFFSSNKCSYGRFEARSFEDIMNGLNVKSMAWKDRNDYSLTSHLHDSLYSRVSCIANPLHQDSPEKIGTLEIITSSDINNKVVIDIKVPVINPPLPPQPMIGTFKFVSAKTWEKMKLTNGYDKDAQIDPYGLDNRIRDTFDGWVWANGTEIQNKSSQLSAAAQIFAGNSSAASFRVPNFSNFFKANPKSDTSYWNSSSNNFALKDATLGMAAHNHHCESMVVAGTFSLDLEATEVINNSDCTQISTEIYKGFHHGNDHTEQHTVTAYIKTSSLNFPAAQTTYSPSTVQPLTESNQPYPKHNVIPVMIYIGGVTKKYFENQ